MNTNHVPQQREWLLPSVALERFIPPKELLWSGSEQKAEQNRYGFRIGSLNLLIKAELGSQVIRLQAVSILPGSAPYLLGLMNLRGNLVPLFDLRLALGLGQSGPAPAHLVLILDKGENAVGMLIDGFPLPLAALRPIAKSPQLPALLERHIHAAYVHEEQIWLDFDHESFFDKLTRAGADQS